MGRCLEGTRNLASTLGLLAKRKSDTQPISHYLITQPHLIKNSIAQNPAVITTTLSFYSNEIIDQDMLSVK